MVAGSDSCQPIHVGQEWHEEGTIFPGDVSVDGEIGSPQNVELRRLRVQNAADESTQIADADVCPLVDDGDQRAQIVTNWLEVRQHADQI